MKLALRLSIAISLGICLVLGGNAWRRFDQERQDYRADAQRDHAAFGRGLANAIEFVWERDGEDVALEAVEQFNQRESHLIIRWVWAKPKQHEGDHLPRDRGLSFKRGQKTRSQVVVDADGTEYMLTYAAVDVPGRVGALELYESLAHEAVALRTILWRAAATTALLLLLCVGLTFGFGVLFVATPLRALVAKADRIGAGDLSGPLELGQDSEIRDLALAMNTMCERLSDARKHVEQETRARLNALEQLRHADRLRTVGELSSGIAHQLGTPLNVMRARGSMIARGEVSEARMRELGTVIVDHVDRISLTIRELLDFARREQPSLSSRNLLKTLQQTVSLVEPLANQRHVQVELSSEQPRAHVRMDPTQIHQALTNILINALHVTPEGAAVRVVLCERDGGFEVAIHDVGDGIAPEHLPHIFEPFYTTKLAGEGTGLGLSVADGIVRQHGGHIEVESGRQGTVFRVWLPRALDGNSEPVPSA